MRRGRPLFHPLAGLTVYGAVLPVPDGNHNNHNSLVHDLIDESIAGSAQFDFVAVRHTG